MSNEEDEQPRRTWADTARAVLRMPGQVVAGYDEVVHSIIRPPRAEYSLEELGPKRMRVGCQVVTRRDFEVKNDRDLLLQCSMHRPAERMPCVIYLHGNCGCRADALEALEHVIKAGAVCLSADLSGSGHSDGQYISLGYFERFDVQCLVKFLRKEDRTTTIGLWGRSMGAVTALLFASMEPVVSSLVLDSPFASFTRLSTELVTQVPLNVPQFAISSVRAIVRSSVRSRAKFDIYELNPLGTVESAFVPALFAHGKEDVFIPPHHTDLLYDKYAGDKNRIKFEGDHNSVRPPFFYDSASIWLQNTLLSDAEATHRAQFLEGLSSSSSSAPQPSVPRVGDIISDQGVCIPGGMPQFGVGRSAEHAGDYASFGFPVAGAGAGAASTEEEEEEALLQRALEVSLSDTGLQQSGGEEGEEGGAAGLATEGEVKQPEQGGARC